MSPIIINVIVHNKHGIVHVRIRLKLRLLIQNGNKWSILYDNEKIKSKKLKLAGLNPVIICVMLSSMFIDVYIIKYALCALLSLLQTL